MAAMMHVTINGRGNAPSRFRRRVPTATDTPKHPARATLTKKTGRRGGAGGGATASIAGVFLRAPKTLRYLRANPTLVPSEIPGALDGAGLLVREDGKPRKRRYSMSGQTPWGHRDHLLIR